MTKTYKLSEYKSLDFFVKHIDLTIDLSKKPVTTDSKLLIEPNTNCNSKDLFLDGYKLSLNSILLDGKMLSPDQFEITDEGITIKNVPQGKPFTLETTTSLSEHTDLFGLYETEGIALVKAETEGFKRITFYNDRPDNLATFTTTIIADKTKYPVLLSNGKLVEKKQISEQLHSVTWDDKTPKPSYLFAMVAGDLEYSVTHFKRASGLDLPIEFYVPASETPQCEFAKDVLKKAMKWDEETYGLTCDLEQHMVVGVNKYASGASETTGLNLFNTANLYGSPAKSTDEDLARKLEVIAHEFYHYWSGNRVTIRDWFNLTFKEGLTTFRAAMFREALFGTDIVRLIDGKNLDPQAPRQETYEAVRSLYTAAAYEKSADIFRMIMLHVGQEQFYEAMNTFFKKYDGGAVTLEQVLEHITASTRIDVNQFLPWFTQSGIPHLKITDEYHAESKEYVLHIEMDGDKSRPIPLLLGLLDQQGNEIISDDSYLLNTPFTELRFENISERPIPSLLRSFSAPVTYNYKYSNSDLLVLMKNDTNQYNRVEAARKLIANLIETYCNTDTLELGRDFFNTYRFIISDTSLTPWMRAELLTIPSEEALIAQINKPDFEKIAAGRMKIHQALSDELNVELHGLFTNLQKQPPNSDLLFEAYDITEVGKRRLNYVCFDFFRNKDPENSKKYLVEQFNDSLGKNMTQTLNALILLRKMNHWETDDCLNRFYEFCKDDSIMLNYWFKLLASTHSEQVVDEVSQLLNHPAFDLSNPNKVFAVLGTFIRNPYGFHALSGKGYELVANTIIALDKINPAIAARMVEPFTSWDNYRAPRSGLMLKHLYLFNANTELSPDVRNIVKKGLDKAPEPPPLPIKMMFHGKKTTENTEKRTETTPTI